jgi:hypothetical protein
MPLFYENKAFGTATKSLRCIVEKFQLPGEHTGFGKPAGGINT